MPEMAVCPNGGRTLQCLSKGAVAFLSAGQALVFAISLLKKFLVFNVTELEALDCGSIEQERTMSELSRALCLN